MANDNRILNRYYIYHRDIYNYSVWITYWTLIILFLKPVLPEVIYRVDPLALLAATLRTYQRAGCDSEQLILNCPRGTSISIELAQYGRAGDLNDHSLCPPHRENDFPKNSSNSVDSSNTAITLQSEESCTISGLQYALLQSVVGACQKKTHCKFGASLKAVSSEDPCSGIRKFVEIAYKCRPFEFRSKLACENEQMPLICNPYSRIAIYSASFGHIEHENVQCGYERAGNPPENNKQMCVVSYATETVMQICHGRRRCSIVADVGTFGRPCSNDVPMFLKVMYTCIPRKVLKERYETALETDEPQQNDIDLDRGELYDEDQFYKEPEAIPPAPKLQSVPSPVIPFDINEESIDLMSTILPPFPSSNDSNLQGNTSHQLMFETPVIANNKYEFNNVSAFGSRCNITEDWELIAFNCSEGAIVTDNDIIGFISDCMLLFVYIKKHQEQFYIYFIICIVAGVLLCVTAIIARLSMQKNRTCRKGSNSSNSNSGKYCNNPSVYIGSDCSSEKINQAATRGNTHLQHTFGDDTSDVDIDIDITNQIPFSGVLMQNEESTSYAPLTSCLYARHLQPHTTANLPQPSAILLPTSLQEVLPSIRSSYATTQQTMTGNDTKQLTIPTSTLYTNVGVNSSTVNGSMTLRTHILAPTTHSSAPSHSIALSSYVPPTINIPDQHYTQSDAACRTIIPNMRTTIFTSPSDNITKYILSGLPSTNNLYYDPTIPRTLTRGMSATSTQCFHE